jgi:hypothetical protein
MNFEEIKEYLGYHEQESKIFMPNEIFTDLRNALPDSSSHLAFAYSYYYLTSWLYRYTKYVKSNLIDNGKIKKLLGYNEDYKKIDYIIKKNGLLDQIGYTRTVKDFPVLWEYDNYEGLEFTMYSEQREDIHRYNNITPSRKYNIKFPVKAFERIIDGDLETNGTFYDIENTHEIPFEVFMYCLDNEQIGLTGFYIYSFIKRMNDYYRGGWDISVEGMPTDMGISERTISRYLDVLRKYNLIKVEHNQEYFCLGLDSNERKANTYYANEINEFTYEEKEYEKIKIMMKKEFMNIKKSEEKIKDDEFESLFGNKAFIPVEELPY